MPNRSIFQIAGAVAILVMGVALLAGGVWLISLHGSWFYAIAGLGLIATAILLFRQDVRALWLFAVVTMVTLVWSVWEVGLDWWPLAARGDVVFVVGLLLLTPWMSRGLVRRGSTGAEPASASTSRGGRLALAASLGVALVVAVASWMTDAHQITPDGTRNAELQAAVPSDTVPPGEWHAYGRTAAGQRYAPLNQITPANAAQLEVAWTYHTGDTRRPGDPVETTFEATPLKIGNRLYFCTPHQFVIALDATTGQQVWRYDPKILDKLALQHLTCRGLSYYPGRTTAASTPSTTDGVGAATPSATATGTTSESPVPNMPIATNDSDTKSCTAMLFMPTADGRVIALDPESGAVCRNFGGGTGQLNLWTGMPNVRPGAYYSTSPVVVAGDLIIVGGTVLDNVSTAEQSGVIRAFDIASGKLVWNWDSGNPDQTAPLAPGQTYTPNSPNSWSIMSVDEQLGLVYVPLGNQPPDQWGGKRSDSVERYSSSVVALEVATGRVRWVFQTVHHDLWDYDVPSQPSLIDLTRDGQTVPALVQPTKQGEIFVLDRRDGRPILPVTEKPAPQGAASGDHTAPTQPVSALSFDPPALKGSSMWGATIFDQLACRIQFHRLRYEGRFTPPSTQGSLIHPGNFGVFNWGSIAVDPRRQIAFTAPASLAFVSRLVPRKDDTTMYVQGKDQPKKNLPALNENFGAPFAVKLAPFTSVLGLPCQAPPWGYVAAADLTTGRVLWQHRNGTVRDLMPIPIPLKMGVPALGGPVTTAGGVAFLSGTLDYYLRAYDVKTGEQLWQGRLPAGGQATPMTYLAADGRQIVLAIAGGHGSLGTKTGDAVIAFALPKKTN